MSDRIKARAVPFLRSSRCDVALAAALLLLGGCGQSVDRAQRLARLEKPGVNAIWADPALRKEAIALGEEGFATHCAECHGADLKGAPGHHAPDLTDANWLYGGDDIDAFIVHPSDVEKTILHGIHAPDRESRNLAEMPARGAERDLTDAEIADVAEHVLILSDQPADTVRARGQGGLRRQGWLLRLPCRRWHW